MRVSWIELGVLAASSIPASHENIRSLHDQGIRAILSLTEHPLTVFERITLELFEELDMTYHHVPIPDQQGPSVEQAWQIIQIIQEMQAQRRPIFVHCHAGIGRTGTALHLYYLAQGLSLEQAQREIRATRPQCLLITDEQTVSLQAFIAALKSDQPEPDSPLIT